MDRIEDIWDKGNAQISNDKTLTTEYIVKSISESSISITSKLPKIIWFGIFSSVIGGIILIFNLFFYINNKSILFVIIGLFVIEICIFSYLLVQLRTVRIIDTKNSNLKELLIYKIKYLNTQFQLALHCVALSIIIVTFTINLTMENSDGIFELRKVLILSMFYLFVYLINIFLYKTIHNVYVRQLENALHNLKENTLRSFSKELKKHKQIRRIIGAIVIIILVIGIFVLIIKTGN